MAELVGDRAIVLGGSMAGLVAARVLVESFREVLLIDRDQLTGVTGYRRGVPHGRHAHGLLARGHQILEKHFPGLTDELTAAGVESGDFNSDIRWYFNGRRLHPARSGLVSVPASRPVIEYHVRRRVMDLSAVTFHEQCDILGLETTSAGDLVTGVRILRQATGAEETLSADLILDTTGRGSRTPAWLADLGFSRPEEDRVKIGLAYTTRHYELPSDPFGDELAIIPVATPRHPRGAILYRVPGTRNHAELSLIGVLGDHPPTDPDGFVAFARSLPVPDIYHAIRDAIPLDDPVMFGFPASVWRHYENLPTFPRGFLVMGDAVCSFNPVYGQGMSVAALESLTLRRHLHDGKLPQARRFFADMVNDIRAPWAVSAGADLGFPGAEGRRTPMIRMVNAYVARLHDAAAYDGKLTNAFIRVAGLVDPPPALLKPRTALRVLWRQMRPPTVTPPHSEPNGQANTTERIHMRPFRIEIPQADLDELNRRIAAARWPGEQPGTGWERGVPTEYLRELADYWRTRFDWRAAEKRLNQFPQFTTEIDGVDVHFLHAVSPVATAMPLILTHGWPGSFAEFIGVIGPLTDPAAYGGDPADAFHVVVPSIPGYGFSGAPVQAGWDTDRVGRAWAELMRRLGYNRYIAQGGDWGMPISLKLAIADPTHVIGVHLNMFAAFPPQDPAAFENLGEADRKRLEFTEWFEQDCSGWRKLQSTRPHTLAYALTDSPVGQLAWIVEKFMEWSDAKKRPEDAIDRDLMLAIVTIYWLTATAGSSAQLYYESSHLDSDFIRTWAGPWPLAMPVGIASFPADAVRPVRSFAERLLPTLTHWKEFDRGGHFAAVEQPELFVGDVREFAAGLR